MIFDGDKIWVTVSSKINLGDFESVQLEAGISHTLDEVEKNHSLEVIAKVSEALSKQIILKTEEIRDNIDDYTLQPKKKNKHIKPKKQ